MEVSTENYKKVWEPGSNDQLTPILFPKSKSVYRPFTDTEPPADDVIITGFDWNSLRWTFEEKDSLSDETKSVIKEVIASADLTNEQALAVAEFYPDWQVGKAYSKGEMVNYNGSLYRVVQSHNSQADWAPDQAVSLFSKVVIGEDGVEEWIQPTGAHDAYSKGQQIRYKGKLWLSLIDGNVWEPAAGTLWTEVVE